MTHVMAHEDVLSRTDFFADAPPDAPALLMHTFRESSWTPPPSQRSALPDRIRWEIRAFDASGRSLGTAVEALAERRSR